MSTTTSPKTRPRRTTGTNPKTRSRRASTRRTTGPSPKTRPPRASTRKTTGTSSKARATRTSKTKGTKRPDLARAATKIKSAQPRLGEALREKLPAPLRPVVRAIGQRLTGSKPGVLRALLAAIVVGIGAAVLTYLLLRSGS